MIHPPSKNAVLLARITVALLFILIVVGIVLYGISSEQLGRLWRNVADRPSGPMTFRFILQPTMAGLVALRDGVNDARFGRSPYLFSIVRGIEERGPRLWEGIVSTARILILGVVMDLVCQVTFLDTFHPAESVVVAILLAFVPYALLRGPIARVARHWIAG